MGSFNLNILGNSPTMPSLLGKRKSRSAEEEQGAPADAQEILRRHFEAHFKPLDIAARAAPTKASKRANDLHSDAIDDSADGSQDDDDSEADAGQSDPEWGGLSD